MRPNFGTALFKVSHLGLGAAVSDYDGWQEENEERKGKKGQGPNGGHIKGRNPIGHKLQGRMFDYHQCNVNK